MMTAIISATPVALQNLTPYTNGVSIRRLSRFNYSVRLSFPYHHSVDVRLTGEDGEYLLFTSNEHVRAYLLRNGLNHAGVISYD